MYERILAPVDLAHPDRIEKALKSAADLASHYGADLVLVGVTETSRAPSPTRQRNRRKTRRLRR